MYLDQAKKRFYKMLPFLKDPINYEPCSDEDIEEVKRFPPLPIPAAYEEFLRWVGRGCDCFPYPYEGGTYCSGEGADLQAAAVEILEINEALDILPEDAIVFAIIDPGESFAFIRASEGDNPPVHYFGLMENENGRFQVSSQIQWNWASSLEELCLHWIDAYTVVSGLDPTMPDLFADESDC